MRTGYVCFDNSCIEVELATTQKEREIGLMKELRNYMPFFTFLYYYGYLNI